MKKGMILYYLLLLCSSIYGQDKYDYNWLMGYGPADQGKKFGASIIQFSKDTINYISYTPMQVKLHGLPMISDKVGNLLFYSNGCGIYGTDHQLIDNADSFNIRLPSYVWNTACYKNNGPYTIDQGVIILPQPGYEHIYIVFHMLYNVLPLTSYEYLYSEVVVNNGIPKVAVKNQLIFSDSLAHGYTAAVRHGNGRDWWILVPVARSERYRRVLLTPLGIEDAGTILGPPKWDGFGYGRAGQVEFSPDGSWYVRGNPLFGVYLYPFDRCTGTLGIPKIIPPITTNLDSIPAALGVCFSPNNRFLYVSHIDSVIQYDLNEPNLLQSAIKVADVDNNLICPDYPSAFYKMQIGPDGRIYGTGTSSNFCMHVINKPNEKGKACDFQRNAFILPAYAYYSVPVYPNYRLYDLAGSPCDTLGINATDEVEKNSGKFMEFKLYPNPAVDHISLKTHSSESFQLTIENIEGKTVHQSKLHGEEEQWIDIFDFPPGYYLCTLRNKNGQVRTKSFVKM